MSTLRANTIADAAGTGPVTLTGQLAVKMLAKYNHPVPSTERSFNVSSITDVSLGDFTINFTNNFNATDYGVMGDAQQNNGIARAYYTSCEPGTEATSNCQFDSGFRDSGGGAADLESTDIIFGDLA